jgi:hypothetical protein
MEEREPLTVLERVEKVEAGSQERAVLESVFFLAFWLPASPLPAPIPGKADFLDALLEAVPKFKGESS